MRSFLVTAFFCATIFTGYRVSVNSWGGQVFVYMGEQRAPASVRKLGDYSPLDRKSLFTTPQAQLLAPARTFQMPGYVGVDLGHPLLKTDHGAEFACPVKGHFGLFDHVELTFLAVGVADSGEPPKVVFETECLPGSNLNSLAPIWIPKKDFDRADRWVLWNVKLFRQEKPEEFLDIGPAKLREAGPKLLSFDLLK